MPFASKNVARTWLFITIVSIATVYVFGSGEKRLDLKIGFDLTQGANGAPSLRIRDFEESSELNIRAKEDTVESKETKSSGGKVRADSFSDSDEAVKSFHPSKLESSKETKESAKSNNDDDDDDDSSGDKKLSTRGLNAGYDDLEENPSIHGGYRNTDEDSDIINLLRKLSNIFGGSPEQEIRRRRKRHAFIRSKV